MVSLERYVKFSIFHKEFTLIHGVLKGNDLLHRFVSLQLDCWLDFWRLLDDFLGVIWHRQIDESILDVLHIYLLN